MQLTSEHRRFLRFLFVGGLNTAFGYGVFCFFLWLGCHYALAGLLGTVIAVLWNFHTTGKLVFDNLDHRRMLRFFGVYAALYAVGVAECRIGELMGYSAYVTSLVMLLPNAVLGYTFNKVFVFHTSST
jgi:putative flippase GtrA